MKVKRNAHMLKDNVKRELPSHLAFVDTESRITKLSDKTEEHRLWFGYCEIWRLRRKDHISKQLKDQFYFNSADQFVNNLLDNLPRKTKMYVFAHNWQFDAAMLNLPESLKWAGFDLDKDISESLPFIQHYKAKEHYIILLDTMNYFRTSVSQLAESLNMKKLDMPKATDDMQLWYEYCRRDVEIIREAMFHYIEFISKNDLGNFAVTAPSQAFNAYRHRFMPIPIAIHNSETACNLERESYHGARTECLRIGYYEDHFYQLDVNSMYPYVMRQYTYPYKLKYRFENLTMRQLEEILKQQAVVAKVTLNTDIALYPKRINDHLCFPVGEFETVLTTRELKAALNYNHIRKIGEGYVYDAALIFAQYVNALYNLKLQYTAQKNKTFTMLSKLLLNSLYGKFGQLASEWIEYPFEIPNVRDGDEWFGVNESTGEPCKYRCRDGRIEYQVRDQEAFNSFPAIAAHVTADARLILYFYMLTAGIENVYYVDTDSLIVNEDGYRRLSDYIDPSELGKLKVEREGTQLMINTCKDYALDDYVKRKGIRGNAVQLSDRVYEQVQFRSWHASRKDNDTNRVIVSKVRKYLSYKYNKGEVQPGGKVEPFTLSLMFS
jgi:hypothetical protein